MLSFRSVLAYYIYYYKYVLVYDLPILHLIYMTSCSHRRLATIPLTSLSILLMDYPILDCIVLKYSYTIKSFIFTHTSTHNRASQIICKYLYPSMYVYMIPAVMYLNVNLTPFHMVSKQRMRDSLRPYYYML